MGRTLIAFTLFAAAVLAAGCGGSGGYGGGSPTTTAAPTTSVAGTPGSGTAVAIDNFAFSPATLKVKGCLIAFLCSTQIWTRATDTLPGQLAAATGSAGGPQPDPEWASGRTAATPASASSAPKRDAKPRP